MNPIDYFKNILEVKGYSRNVSRICKYRDFSEIPLKDPCQLHIAAISHVENNCLQIEP
jgi:hypothetical protein